MVTNNIGQDYRATLIPQDERRKENNSMVYLSTFIAVCGSYSYGTGIGYSSPSEAAIKKDLNLTISQYSLFGSILTLGAMIGAVASGPMADYFGRKGKPNFIIGNQTGIKNIKYLLYRRVASNLPCSGASSSGHRKISDRVWDGNIFLRGTLLSTQYSSLTLLNFDIIELYVVYTYQTE
ncbi:sugar transporter ERD6-like protein 7 [Tanacetum coccineum]